MKLSEAQLRLLWAVSLGESKDGIIDLSDVNAERVRVTYRGHDGKTVIKHLVELRLEDPRRWV